MEELIYTGRWSIAYRMGAICRKYYLHGNEMDAKKEGTYSHLFEKSGITVPHYWGSGFSEDRKMFYSDFDYVVLEKITTEELFADDIYGQIAKILHLLRSNESAARVTEDGFWHVVMLPSIKAALDVVQKHREIAIDNIYDEFTRMEPDTLIHGDFSLVNIFQTKGTVVLVDFQYSCVGIAHWDKCYLLSSVDGTDIPVAVLETLSAGECRLIEMISLVRLGRGIRKNYEISERMQRYRFWNDFRG